MPDVKKRWTTGASAQESSISLLAVDSINVNVINLLVMGWTKKIETLACGQDGQRPVELPYLGLEPEMEMNKPMLHSEITLLYT